MRGFIGLTKRNLLIYFKDIQSVIFSLLTSIIVFMLYMLFLKSSFIDAIEGGLKGLESFVDSSSVEMLANGILLTGIIGSAMVTVPFNCLQTIIRDRENKIDYDISATPIKRWQIIFSYFLSSTISSVIMTSIILTVGLVTISSQGDIHMSVSYILMAYAMNVIGSISSTSFFMIIMMFFKTSSASGAFFGILSAASGFVIGAYVPISQFSDGIQTFCNIFPASGVTILFRNLLLNGILNDMNNSIGGVDNGAFVDSMKEAFGFTSMLFGNELSHMGTLLYIGVAAVICVALMIVIYSKTYKRG